jgi:hypothetical protein
MDSADAGDPPRDDDVLDRVWDRIVARLASEL